MFFYPNPCLLRTNHVPDPMHSGGKPGRSRPAPALETLKPVRAMGARKGRTGVTKEMTTELALEDD